MSDPIESLPLYRVVELARQSVEARVWNLAVDEDGNPTPPDDNRDVLVFLNGYVDIGDSEGREGGGWGIRMGWSDHDKHYWCVDGHPESFVTHMMDLPGPPQRPEHEESKP